MSARTPPTADDADAVPAQFAYTLLGGISARVAATRQPLRISEQIKLVLGRLLLEPGALVSTDALAGALWGEEDRASRRNGVQHAVRAARRALGDTAEPRQVIVLEGDAYRLIVANPLLIDAERFRALAARGHDLVAAQPRAARAMLAEALSAWQGRLLGEYADRPWVAGHAAELDRVHARAQFDLNEALIALGDYAELATTVPRQIVDHPYDERLRGQLIRALLADGRATEAAIAYRRAIVDLGAPGPELTRLGDQASRGRLDESPTTRPGRDAAVAGNTMLCAQLDRPAREPTEPAMGTIALVIAAYGGVAQAVTPERLMATFEHPDGALNAARAIVSDVRLDPRIGVHADSIIDVGGGRLIGQGPARCRQLTHAAHPGQVLVSGAARKHAAARDDLRALGEQRFADLGAGEELFELAHPRGLAFPAPVTLDRRPHNLPVQPTRFVGRAEELATLSACVSPGTLITLIGPGGCGKTRLALQLAAHNIAAFAAGAMFVGLAELEPGSGVEPVAAAMASQLGVRALPEETVPAAVVRHLSDREMLLVVDNCEQVHEASAELIAQIQVRCRDVCMIATSRSRLGIDSETAWAVAAMDLEWRGGLSDAVELLLERAAPLPSDETQRTEMLSDAAAICRAFDGLPLAIELAAGQIVGRDLASVAAEVAAMMRGERELGGWTSRDPLRPERHRTIESAIGWSYRLLDDHQRRVLRRLAVFRGTFGEDEARHLVADDTGADDVPAADFARMLESLVDASMVAAAAPLAGALRLRLLAPIRAFALEKLTDDGDLEHARARHASVFFEVAVRSAPGLFDRAEQATLERLEADHDNVTAALTWYAEGNHALESLRLVGALWWLWFSRGHLEEGSTWVQRVLALDAQASRERVRALRCGSHLSWWRGDFARCQAYNAEMRACAEAIDDEWGLAWALMGVGAVEMFREPREALARFEESKRRFEALGRPWEAGYALQVSGGAQWFGGDDRAALTAYDGAVAIFEDLGHSSVLASARRGAGLMAARCGHPARGTAMCQQALRLSDTIGDRAGSAQALNFLAAISRDDGDLKGARENYASALALAYEVGELWATCWALDGIAGIARVVGEPQIATRLLAHSGRLATRAGYRQSPHELRLRESDITHLQRVLSDSDFEREGAEGALMTVGTAVECALAFAARHA